MNSDDRNDRLDEAAAAWLKATEQGETPDPQEWFDRYPDLTAELAEFFAGQQSLDRLVKPLRQVLHAAGDAREAPRPESWLDESTIAPAGRGLDADTVGPNEQSPAAATPTAARPRTFGDYELLTEIARGGMGVVYKARQTRLNRMVAVKMILSGQLADGDEVQRFLVEAEAAAGLDHPGIVPVYESGQIAGQHFFSMGYVDGRSLAALLAAGPLPPRQAAELLVQVTDAVDYAHRQGVIHRDLKPGNILLDNDGRPRVTDFGLAKRVTGDSGLTHTGQALGTPSYMPPEQASGNLEAIGPASDVYALGAVLYATLTGRPPFQAANALDTLLQVLEQEPVAPRELNPDVPRDLETIALKCLEKEPHKRYATARELSEELGRFLRSEPILARPISRLERAWRWRRRNPLAASLATAAMLALISGTVVSAYFAVEARRRARDAETSADVARDERRAAQAAEHRERQQRLAAQAARAKEKQERLRAERQLRKANALRLASQAREALPDWPQRAALLAAAAVESTVSAGEPRLAAAEQALRDALATVSGLPLSTAPSQVAAMTIDRASGELLTAGEDWVVRSWDLDGGVLEKRTWTLPEASGDRGAKLKYAAFSRDGRWLATPGRLHELLHTASDGKLEVRSWDLSSRVAGLPFFHFSPDGNWLFAGGSLDDGMLAWKLSAADPSASVVTFGGRSLAPIDPNATCFDEQAAISPDGRWLATSSFPGNSMRYAEELWDLSASDPLATRRRLSGRNAMQARLAFSPKTRWLAVSSMSVPGLTGNATDNKAGVSIELWDLSQAFEAPPRKLRSQLAAGLTMAFSSDERWLAVGGATGAELFDLADAEKDSPAHQLPGVRWSPSILMAAFVHGDRWLATVGGAGHVRLWDLRAADPAAAPLALTENTSGARRLAASPDGRVLAVVGGDNAIRLWNLAADDPAATALVLRGQEESGFHLVFSPNGRWLVAGLGIPRIWDVEALAASREPFSSRVGANHWRGWQFSPDGRWLLAQESSQAVLYDLSLPAPCEQPHKLDQPGSRSFRAGGSVCAFSSDGHRLAIRFTGLDGFRDWDLSQDRPVLAPTDCVAREPSASPTLQVSSLAFSANDRWLVASSRNRQVWLFDARQPTADPLPLAGAEWARSPDNRWLLTLDEKGAGHRYDLTQAPPAETAWTWAGTGGKTTKLLLSPAGRHLFKVGMGGSAQLCSIDSPQAQLFDLGKAEYRLGDAKILFLPNKPWLAYIPDELGENRNVRLCNVESLDPTSSFVDLTGHASSVAALAVDAEGRRLASSSLGIRDLASGSTSNGSLRVWNLAELPKQVTSVVLHPHDKPDHRLAISPDGRWVAVGGEKQFDVQLWDLDASDDYSTPVLLSGFTSPIKEIAFSPDNRWLLAGNGSGGELRMWRLGTPALLEEVGRTAARTLTDEERNAYRLAASPPTVAEDVPSGSVRKRGSTLSIRQYLAPATSVAFSPDGRRLLAGGWHGTLKMCDCDGGDPAILFKHAGPVWNVAFSPDGERFASAGGDGKVFVGKVADGARLAEFKTHDGGVHDLQFDPRRARLATCGADGAVKFWDPASGELLDRIRAHDGQAWGLAFDASGQRLCTAGHDKLVKVWDVASRRELCRCSGHADVVWDADFSPDGQSLASVSDDRTVKVWDAATGKEMRSLPGHSISPYRVLFSPDGKLLFSAAAHRWQSRHAGEVLGWDTADWKPFAKHRKIDSGYFSLAASPDGQELAGARTDGMLDIWPLAQKNIRPQTAVLKDR